MRARATVLFSTKRAIYVPTRPLAHQPTPPCGAPARFPRDMSESSTRRVHMAFRLFVPLIGRSELLCSMLWKLQETIAFLANRFFGLSFCPVSPSLAVSPCAGPSRRARGMFEFCVRQIKSLSSPKPGHTTGGSGRGGARRILARPDREGRRRVDSPRKHPASLAFRGMEGSCG